MMIKLTDKDLEQFARDFFREVVSSYADMEDSMVMDFVNKVVEKHKVPLSIVGNSLTMDHFKVCIPSGPFGARMLDGTMQRVLPLDPGFLRQVNEAETRF